MGQLSTLKAKALSQPGRYTDRDGLMLIVKPGGSKSWLLRIQHKGKRRDIGLGSFKDVTLADARERAADPRKLSRSGLDPLEAKAAARRHTLGKPAFREAAKKVHDQQRLSWRNGKHRDQWISTLERYAFPLLWDRPVDQIEAADIINLLDPIWLRIPETAKRVKQRIGVVLDWSFSQGFRPAEAPMRAISRGLPRQLKGGTHFPALSYDKVPNLIEKLGKSRSTGSLALRFLIHTAARSGEVRGATWGEIDWREETWVIPAERMKNRKEHIVPLNTYALEVLTTARPDVNVWPDDPIFPGLRGSLSDMTLSKALKAHVTERATVHGLRSSFRDWAAEQTEVAGEVVEAALAHTVTSKVEAAYRRTNYLEKRRKLMGRWAEYIRQEIELNQRDSQMTALRAPGAASDRLVVV